MRKKNLLFVSLVIFTLFAGVAVWFTRFNFVPNILFSTLSTSGEKFPDIDLTKLNPTQKKIITVARQEFNTQPDYKKYTQGSSEPWCADFVSWIYKSADMPFTNPNSGSWRIPGTHTLRDYLVANDRLKPTSAGFTPKPGDLMLYDNPNPFGQHVNIVLKINKDGSITTIGGNEPGGIRVKTHRANLERGFVGYGTLD